MNEIGLDTLHDCVGAPSASVAWATVKVATAFNVALSDGDTMMLEGQIMVGDRASCTANDSWPFVMVTSSTLTTIEKLAVIDEGVTENV